MKYFCKVKAGTPDGVEAPVGEGDHWVDVDDEVEAPVDEVDPDVHGCDLPMSIYSQLFITLSVNCFDQSFRLVFKLVKDYKDFKFGRQVLLLHPVCLHLLPLHVHLLVLPLVGGG